MENEKNMNNGGMCQCSCHGLGLVCRDCGHAHRRFFLLRWLLGALIILIVFAVGIKVGEFKQQFRDGSFGFYGHGTYNMMGRGFWQYPGATGPMMYGVPLQQLPGATTTPKNK